MNMFDVPSICAKITVTFAQCTTKLPQTSLSQKNITMVTRN